MGGFQIAALGVLGLLLVMTVAATVSGRLARRAGVVWSLIWLVAGVSVAWPGTTTVVAAVLGIGRGADLVLYCFCVLVLVGFFMTYTRIRRLDSAITTLTRHLALREVARPGPSKLEPGQSPDGPCDEETDASRS